MSTLDRRQFLLNGLSAAAGLTILPNLSFARTSDDEHFYIRVFLDGGVDCSYLFDARPLEMTQAHLIQNYLGTEASLLTGSNGTSTWASSLTNPLKPYLSELSIVNGVLMAHGFDGHGQNLNFSFSGNPFGGESFVPHFNRMKGSELDAILLGDVFRLKASNHTQVVPFSLDSAAQFASTVKGSSQVDFNHPLFSSILNNMNQHGNGKGRFAAGSKRLADSYSAVPDLSDKVSKINSEQFSRDTFSHEERSLHLANEFFKNGVAKSLLYFLRSRDTVDTHESMAAKSQPRLYANYVSRMANILKAMKEIEYKDGKSLMDVTTIEFCSEFSRTMRQNDLPIDNTGTDHNPLNTSILLAGKGIRGGQVIGQSDFRNSNEELSEAHLSFDRSKLKCMGRPFDFKNYRPREDKPSSFKVQDYLTYKSVANTLFENFKVPKTEHWLTERNGPTAPVLKSLLY